VASVSWAQIEPQEGKVDFSVLDGVIPGARSHNLRLAPLWFATWKNRTSSCPPDWLKKDFERFPRAQLKGGKSIEALSACNCVGRWAARCRYRRNAGVGRASSTSPCTATGETVQCICWPSGQTATLVTAPARAAGGLRDRPSTS
jgi:hypothetical protein